METQIFDSIESSFPIRQWSQFTTLIAVSGGIDSVALLRAMTSMAERADAVLLNNQHSLGIFSERDSALPHGSTCKARLVVAHVNHQTRVNSDDDQAFVAQLAESLGLRFVSASLPRRSVRDPHEQRASGNCTTAQPAVSEEVLRHQRYETLVGLARQVGARFLVTGHQRQDQTETILFRLFRGTGLTGLQGIPVTRLVDPALTLIRPILNLDRAMLVAYLVSLGQDFCPDPTNAETNFTRNFIRHELLPLLDSRFGGSVETALLRLSEQASESQNALDQWAERFRSTSVQVEGERVTIDRSSFQQVGPPDQKTDLLKQPAGDLSAAPPVVIRTLLRSIWREQGWSQQKMSAHWWQVLARALMDPNSELTRFDLPHGIVGELRPGTLLLFPHSIPRSIV